MTGRLSKAVVEGLTPEQRVLYDAIAGGPRAQGRQAFALTDDQGRLEGPFNAMLLSPGLGGRLQDLGAAVRYASTLDDRARELAILVVAYAWDSDFERYAHERVARAAGVQDAEMATVRDGRFEGIRDDRERLIVTTVHALAVRSDLTDDEYRRARDGLGEPVLFELSTLVGYYALLALQLRLFRVAAPR